MTLLPVWVQRILQFVGYLVLLAVIIWSVGALWFFDVLPAPLPRVLSVAWAIILLVLFFGWRIFGLRPLLTRHFPWLPEWFTVGVPHSGAIAAALVGYATIFLAWKLKTPSADRIWIEEQARDITVRYEDGTAVIDNVRNAVHRAPGDMDVRWETRRYSLDAIRSLDVIIEPFMEFEGISHFIMSFGFDGGEQLAVSVEARVEAAEQFGVIPALFKEFELVYIVGDERDLLWSRVDIQNHPVFVYPVRVQDREQLRALFVLVLNHAAALGRRPQFYNTLLNNCTNAQLRHIEYLTASRFPWLDYRLILPGFVDRFLYDHGALAGDRPLEDLRREALINPRAINPQGMEGPEWSMRIRGTQPPQ